MTTRQADLQVLVVGRVDSPYLPQTLAALAEQTHPVGQVLLGALGQEKDASTQDWDTLVGASGLHPDQVRVVPVPGAPTFGAAARRVLRAVQDGAASSAADPAVRRWLWLLHDDSAPAPEALEHLLTAVDVRSEERRV